MAFTTKQLKSLAYNTQAFDAGVELFLEDKISNFNIYYKQIDQVSLPAIVLHADVTPLASSTSFNTNIQLSTKDVLLNMQCSCDHFLKTHNACPHLLATLFYYSDDSAYWLAQLPQLNIPSSGEASPLKIKACLDTEYSYVTLKIVWQYPDVTIDAVSRSIQGYIATIKRDRNAESTFKNLIGKYHFEFYTQNLLYLHKSSDIFQFITKGMDELKNFCDLSFSPAFEQLTKTSLPNPQLNITLEQNHLYLDFGQDNLSPSELEGLLQAYSNGDSHYRLASGKFLSLTHHSSEELENLKLFVHVLSTLFPNEKGTLGSQIVLPAYHALHLNQTFSNYTSFSITKNKAFRKLIDDVTHANHTNYAIPDTLYATLRNYQITGFKWLKSLSSYGLGGILADDMGLGKTIQTITLLLSESNTSQHPSLIVCPTSLVLNWAHELTTFAPSLRVLVISGNASKRLSLLSQVEGYDIILTSYDLLARDILDYQDLEFHYCIADEAHYIKSRRTLKSKALKSIRSHIRFALSGTPIENSLTELWSIFDFIMPGYLFTAYKFSTDFDYPITKLNSQSQATLLQNMIAPFILRRLKSDVLQELPPKTETVCYIPMTAEQETIYQTYTATTLDTFNTEIATLGFNRSHIKILSLITRLRQVCCHPQLCIPQYTGDSGKLGACLELVTTSIEAGHKVLIFSQFTSMLDILEAELSHLNISHYTLRGSTPSHKRLELVDQFNTGNVPVFLISLKAGGVGLNLTSADIVIHYDPWWNVSAQNQATDRAHRIGQVNPVQVYKLITQNSIEEKIELLQQQKLNLTEQVLQTGETFISQLSQEEIMNLFSL